MSDDLLRRGLDALGVRAEAADLLARYLGELDRWNRKYGFVKATAEELVTRHALDSIAGAPVVARLCGAGTEPGAVLDVGSGAGFPGIPLAIALPRVGFTLLERSSKKCAFLENCRALLGLVNVRVLPADLAEARGSWDVITFRAVAPLDRFLADLARSNLTWRWIAAYKGRRDRVDAELAALDPAARGAEVVRLPVPFADGERHLVVISS